MRSVPPEISLKLRNRHASISKDFTKHSFKTYDTKGFVSRAPRQLEPKTRHLGFEPVASSN